MTQAKIGWRPYVDSGLDTDATLFSTAASLTDATQKSAINTLVKDLKRFGLWNKIRAFYPFVGGSAETHKWNLKDPRDLDAAYRLTFSGGWTHSANGIKANGSNTSANTFLNLRTVFGATSTQHNLGIYINENPIQSLGVRGYRTDISANDGTNVIDAWVGGNASQMFIRNIPSADWFSNLISPFDVTGLSEIKRYKDNYYCITRNGEEVQNYRNVTATTRYNPNANVVIGSSSSSNRYGTAYITEALDTVETYLMYVSVQRYNSTLGRQTGTAIPTINISTIQPTQTVVTTGMKINLDARTLSKPAEGATGTNGNWYLGVTPGNYFMGGTIWTDQSGSGNNGTFWANTTNAGGDARSGQYFIDDLGIPEVRFRDTDNAVGRYKLYQHGSSPDALTTTYKGSDTGTYTFGGWVKMNSLHNYFSFNRGEDSVWGGGAWSIILSGSSGGKLGINLVASGGSIQGTAVAATTFKPDNWYNIYCVWKPGSYIKYYINGVLQVTNAMTFTTLRTPNGPYGWLLNTSKVGTYHYRGIFGAFHVYDRELTAEEIKQNFDADKDRYNVTYVEDADAHAFVTAAGITSKVQANAVNTLVTSLKTAGIWSKMKAIYPFVGGSAESHKFNLKDPRDADAAFRLVFNGGSTHDSNGYSTNGSNSYADTKLKPSVSLALNSASFGVYSTRERVGWGRVVMGTTVGTGWILFYIRTSGNTTANVIHSDWSGGSGVPSSSAKGFFQISRINTTQITSSINNNIYVNSGNATAMSTGNLYINAANGLDIGQYADNINYAYAYIGDGLTSSELSTHNTIIQAYQTALGRQV